MPALYGAGEQSRPIRLTKKRATFGPRSPAIRMPGTPNPSNCLEITLFSTGAIPPQCRPATIAEETVGHPHKFRANHGEARARHLEFIVNSLLSRLVETPAIKDKISPGTSGNALLDEATLAGQNGQPAGACLEPRRR